MVETAAGQAHEVSRLVLSLIYLHVHLHVHLHCYNNRYTLIAGYFEIK